MIRPCHGVFPAFTQEIRGDLARPGFRGASGSHGPSLRRALGGRDARSQQRQREAGGNLKGGLNWENLYMNIYDDYDGIIWNL